MVATSRCLGSLVAFATGAVGARIQKKARSGVVADKAQDCYSPYDGLPMLRLQACPEGTEKLLESLGCTILEDNFGSDIECSGTEIICSKEAATQLEEAKLATIALTDAGGTMRQASGITANFTADVSAASDFYTAWRDMDAQYARVDSLVQGSGGIATVEVAGQSLQGRDMRIVRFRGSGYTPGDTRVVVGYNMHAREWITGMSAVYMVEQLIETVKQEPDYLDGMEVVLMPIVNPDGFYYTTTTERYHRKNMRPGSCIGVDLNRNWAVAWGGQGSSGSECSETYRGSSAESEPETQVLKSVINEAQTTVFVDVHCYTQLILSSWAYTTAINPREAEYRAIGDQIQAAIRNAQGNTWEERQMRDVAGVSNDYADSQGALGFCFELRPGSGGGLAGFAPPTSDILPGAQEAHAGIMAAIDYAKSAGNPAPTPAPPTPPPGTWVVTGSGCEEDGNCVQSANYPSNYGNNQQCSVALGGSTSLTTQAFSTESGYDFLSIGGSQYSGSNGPPSGTYSGTITWSSDYSVAQSGWRLCQSR